MLAKPNVRGGDIAACLEREHGLHTVEIAFLPLGADVDTAVYRAIAQGGTPYFVKLRRGAFDAIAVTLPRFLSDQGMGQIIPPLPTKTGRLWAHLDAYRVIVSPFIAGRDGYEVALSEGQWRELGKALKAVHASELPAALRSRIPLETYSPLWRNSVRSFLERVGRDSFKDPAAVELVSFLQARREEVLHLVERAGELCADLRRRSPDPVVCHSDLHAGNVLLTPDQKLYIVDWDAPLLACRERDLMSVGGGLFGRWYKPHEEEMLFYDGYGPAKLDPFALAYYRYERIVQDIAAFCQQIFAGEGGGEDREQSLRYVQLNWLPGGTIERAREADSAGKRYGPVEDARNVK
jgi:spectinomycin phosphotransferase